MLFLGPLWHLPSTSSPVPLSVPGTSPASCIPSTWCCCHLDLLCLSQLPTSSACLLQQCLIHIYIFPEHSENNFSMFKIWQFPGSAFRKSSTTANHCRSWFARGLLHTLPPWLSLSPLPLRSTAKCVKCLVIPLPPLVRVKRVGSVVYLWIWKRTVASLRLGSAKR